MRWGCMRKWCSILSVYNRFYKPNAALDLVWCTECCFGHLEQQSSAYRWLIVVYWLVIGLDFNGRHTQSFIYARVGKDINSLCEWATHRHENLTNSHLLISINLQNQSDEIVFMINFVFCEVSCWDLRVNKIKLKPSNQRKLENPENIQKIQKFIQKIRTFQFLYASFKKLDQTF